LIGCKKERFSDLSVLANQRAKWFTDHTRKEVYWPPVKTQEKYQKILKRMKMPTNEWMLCSVKKLFFETGKQHDLNICAYKFIILMNFCLQTILRKLKIFLSKII